MIPSLKNLAKHLSEFWLRLRKKFSEYLDILRIFSFVSPKILKNVFGRVF